MAKKSAIEKNKRRAQAGRRSSPPGAKRLKAIANDRAEPMEERFEAR